jgi:hypothetical protein
MKLGINSPYLHVFVLTRVDLMKNKSSCESACEAIPKLEVKFL